MMRRLCLLASRRLCLLASTPAVARSEWSGTSDDRWDTAVRDLAVRSGRVCVDERADGQCLFRAVARQLGDGPPKRPLLAAEISECRECVAHALATHADEIARRSREHRAALHALEGDDARPAVDAAEDAAAAAALRARAATVRAGDVWGDDYDLRAIAISRGGVAHLLRRGDWHVHTFGPTRDSCAPLRSVALGPSDIVVLFDGHAHFDSMPLAEARGG